MWLAWKELVWLSHLTIGIWTIFVKSVSTSLISHLGQRFLGDILNGLQCRLAFIRLVVLLGLNHVCLHACLAGVFCQWFHSLLPEGLYN
jgi:hypothetical protein